MIKSVPHILGARFELGAVIGAGNYAQIYRATDSETGESVAIKVLRSEHAQDPMSLSLFEQEAVVGLSVPHQNVARTRLFGRDGDTHFIVMDLVPGISLRRRMQLTGRLPIAEALRIMQGVLSGLEAIHQAGFIHRDIKPQNILLAATGIPKIVDFGIAKQQGDASGSPGGVALGTAAYIAPEQVMGQQAGPEADVYAAGAVLFEMLTGQAPFPGDDPIEVMNRHLTEPPPDPRVVNSEVSPALATIVVRALAKQPAERFATARELRERLDALQPVEAPAPAGGLARIGNLFGLTAARTVKAAAAVPERGPTTRSVVPALLMTVVFSLLVLATVGTGAVRTSQPRTAATLPANQTPVQAVTGALGTVESPDGTIPTGWSASAAVSSPRESISTLEYASASAAVSAPAQTNLTIFDNDLAAGWDTSLSWSASVELAALETPESSVRSISYTPTGAWAGLQIRSDGTVNTASFTAIQFSVKSTRNGEPLAIYLRDASYHNLSNPIPLSTFGGYPAANGWTTYTIPLVDLNAATVTLGSIVIHSWANHPQPTIYVNNIRLLTATR